MVQSTLGMSPQTSLRTLLEAGVHFGHQTKRWNPKMKPYIFTERNGIHIIDLQQTVKQLEDAHNFVADLTAHGGKVLFVGTKKQAQEVVAREAGRSRSVLRQPALARRHAHQLRHDSPAPRATARISQKQSAAASSNCCRSRKPPPKRRSWSALERTLGGMRDMTQLPGALFVIDPKREHLAIARGAAAAHSGHRDH